MTSTPLFAAHHDAYLDAGWSGILVLPPDAKASPPAGYTGADGRWPTRADIDRWAREQPAGNIALRLPRDVIGVDFDLYRNPDARALLEELTGPLPPTWCSTSRVDGSGIRFYRVPCPPSGTVWRSGGDGYDIVQHHHRYAVVWPSVHPEGRTYLWIDETSGEIAERPPEIDDLTELPWAAIAALTLGREAAEQRAPVDLAIPAGDMSVTVERRLMAATAATRGERGSRHDAACRDVTALLRLAERGEPGVDRALAVLRDAFIVAVTPDRPGAGAAAEREFDTIVTGATKLVAATVGRIPTRAERAAEWLQVREIAVAPRAIELGIGAPESKSQVGGVSPSEPTTWEPVDLAAILGVDYVAPRPEICTRNDGAALFYAGRVNALNGESGGGKSWVALAACAQQLAAGHHVIYIDLEDHAGSIVGRLRRLGVTDSQVAAGFRYVAPVLPFNHGAQEQLCELVAGHDVTLVVIDSVGEAMALQAAKQNDDDDVARWFRLLPRRVAALGPAVVLIDHVPKQNDDTKLFAIGSQRKRAAIDGAAYRVDTVVAFSVDKRGKIALVCAKDRNGFYAQQQVVAEVHVDPKSHSLIDIAAPAGRNREGAVTRPTVLMERISRFLEEQKGMPISKREIERMVPGKADAKRTAIDVLEAEGHIEGAPIVVGIRKSAGIGFRSIKPYRDESEPFEPDAELEIVDARPRASQARPGASQDAGWTTQQGASTRVPTPSVGGVGGDAPCGPTDLLEPEQAAPPSTDPFEGLL